MNAVCKTSFFDLVINALQRHLNPLRRKPIFRLPERENGVLRFQGTFEWGAMSVRERNVAVATALELQPKEFRDISRDTGACIEIARRKGVPIELSVKSNGQLWAGVPGAGYDWEPNASQFEHISAAEAICKVLLRQAGFNVVDHVIYP